MIQSLERKKMKKDQIQELEKRVDAIEQKIDEYLELLYEKNTYNLFIEDIRQEIRDLERLISSAIR
jgi:prefoldin subunit 5